MIRRLTNLARGIHELITHHGQPTCDYATDGRPCLGRRNAAWLVRPGQPTRRACRTTGHRRALIGEATTALRDGIPHAHIDN